MITSSQNIPLSIQYAELKENTVKNLHWPIARAELCLFRDVLFSDLYPYLRKSRQQNVFGACEMEILLFYFLSDLMGIFQGRLLFSRLKKEDGSPSYQYDAGRIWSAIAKGILPDLPPLFNELRVAFPRRSTMDVIRKFTYVSSKFKKGIQPKTTPITPVPDVAWDNDFVPRISTATFWDTLFSQSVILTVKRGDIIDAHAYLENATVRYIRMKKWFRPLESSKSVKNFKMNNGFVSKLIEIVCKAFDTQGVPFTPDLHRYIWEWVNTGCFLVNAHLLRLRNKARTLPHQLWSGSAGNIWDRMLRVAVRESGGRVVGHSHALGSYYINNILSDVNDFFECDEYYVYSKQQKNTLLNILAAREDSYSEHPIVRNIDAESGGLSSFATHYKDTSVLHKVMFVATPYFGEHCSAFPCMPDVIALDWQIRLLSRIKLWGYEPVLKEHPECNKRAPTDIMSKIGASCECQPFENVLADVDVVIFANEDTSTFNITLRTNKPMVFIDFKHQEFAPGAVELLNKRCAVVDGWYDDENRPQVNWNELKRAIVSSRLKRNNDEFARYYLP